MSNEIEDAINVLKKAFKDDRELAFAWHCNLAMSFSDAIPVDHETGLDDHLVCNQGATRFMKLCFGVDTYLDMITAQPKVMEKEIICNAEHRWELFKYKIEVALVRLKEGKGKDARETLEAALEHDKEVYAPFDPQPRSEVEEKGE